MPTIEISDLAAAMLREAVDSITQTMTATAGEPFPVSVDEIANAILLRELSADRRAELHRDVLDNFVPW